MPSEKNTPGKTPRQAASRRGEVTQGKHGVAITACVAVHYSRENPA